MLVLGECGIMYIKTDSVIYVTKDDNKYRIQTKDRSFYVCCDDFTNFGNLEFKSGGITYRTDLARIEMVNEFQVIFSEGFIIHISKDERVSIMKQISEIYNEKKQPIWKQ